LTRVGEKLDWGKLDLHGTPITSIPGTFYLDYCENGQRVRHGGQGHEFRADSGSQKNPTSAQYGDLADVPPELEWLANITNKKTRRAYKLDVSEFSVFTGLTEPAQMRTVT
jgi:hypothetical protein